jgi:hypothetical protein
VHSSSMHFVRLCKLLVKQMETLAPKERSVNRDATLDVLMDFLLTEGLVFDRSFAGLIHDQLLKEGEPENDSAIQALRQRIQAPDYLSPAMIDSLGNRMTSFITGR